MRFNSEKDLESHIRKLISENKTLRKYSIYPLENKKAVDIVICRDGSRSALFFIEIKLCKLNNKNRRERIGVGTKNGKGFQPEILKLNPSYFSDHLRWVLVRKTNKNTEFIFVSSSLLRNYLAGKSVGKKYNNINPSIFKEHHLSYEEFAQELEKWLIETN